MKKSRFTKQQIIAALKEDKVGAPIGSAINTVKTMHPFISGIRSSLV